MAKSTVQQVDRTADGLATRSRALTLGQRIRLAVVGFCLVFWIAVAIFFLM